jgi:RNA polymerase sigma factor (sigma-70 family)
VALPSEHGAAVSAGFDEFFYRESERLFRALYFVTASREDAEELMQDAFLKLWERWDRIDRIDDPTAYLFRVALNGFAQDAFVRVVGRLGHLRDPGAFDAYLRRAVVNLAKNHYRRRAIERRFLSRSTAPEPVPAPEHQLVDRQTIVVALGRLSERQRAAIVLRYYEDLSEDAIAQILRCRPATVRSLIARGVHLLRGELLEALDA